MATLKTDDDMNLKKYFYSDVTIHIPLNQRMYSWGQPQIEDYWNDLLKVYKHQVDYHYIGVISLIFTDSNSIHQIVDGQQRIITTALLIAAMRDIAIFYNIDDHSRELHSRNFINIVRGEQQYKLISSKIDKSAIDVLVNIPNDKSKLFPYNRNVNEIKFRLSYFDENTVYNNKIQRTYSFFIDRINELIQSNVNAGNLSIAEVKVVLYDLHSSLEKMRLILVKSDDKDHLYNFFESLNNKGLQLNKFDIIRNSVLEIAHQKFETDCETIADKWDEIYLNLDGLDALRFLKYFLICSPENIIIQEPQLHQEYVKKFQKVETEDEYWYLLDSMILYAKVFSRLFQNHYNLNAKENYEKCIYYINEIGQQATHSFIMDLLIYNDIAMLNAVLFPLEKMMFKRAISGSSTKQLDGIFRSLIKIRYDKGEYVLDDILTIIAANTPSMDEFIESSKYREWENDSLTNYALRKIETYLMGDKAKDNLLIKDRQNVHIEHIAPLNYTEEWQNIFNNIPKEEYRRIIRRIGNLVLLESKFNQSIKDSNYCDKRISLECSRSSLLQVSLVLDNFDDWNKNSIDLRTDELLKLFEIIWG